MALLTVEDYAVLAEMERRESQTFGREVKPIRGLGDTWEEFQRRWWPDVYPNADYHVRMWEWFDGLEPGVKPCPERRVENPSALVYDALVEVIFRGGGKSSTAEAGIVWTGAKASRNFWLYVCATQDAADEHVSNIGNVMERIGIGRAMSTYGVAEGWSANKLRAENGFNVLAIGLSNAKARGLKLDDFRPDGILFDDIDSTGETLYMTGRKIDTVTKAILPSGSRHCVYAFIQNVINANGIMARTLDGRLPMLLNREKQSPVPAIYDMQVAVTYVDGDKRHTITGGRPAWDGKDLDTCQQEINTETYEAFMQECQHDVYRTGVFFTNYSEELHVRRVNQTEGVCPACNGDQDQSRYCRKCRGAGAWTRAPWPIPREWITVGGLDYGRSEDNPFAFLLEWFDFDGNKYVTDEIYESMLSPEKQADLVLAVFEIYGLNPKDVEIFCDPSIFPPPPEPAKIGIAKPEGFTAIKPAWNMTSDNGKKISDVYLAKGLNVRRAMSGNSGDERMNGWAAVNKYLDSPGAMTIYEGRCPNFARTIKNVPKNPNNSLDVDTKSEDHLCDCDRFISRNKGLKAKPAANAEKPRDTLQATQKPSNDWYS